MCVQNKMVRAGRAMLMVTLGIMAAGLLAAQLRAQSFTLSQNGKNVGTASLSLKPANGGFDSTSGAKIDMPGLKYNFNENVLLGSSYRLLNVQLTGSVNGTSATVNTAPQSQAGAQQFLMKITANGKTTETPLAFHPLSVFLPDFDPGALQTLLSLGAAHNNANLWALIPKQAGSVSALRIATNADMQGTLNGQAIAVHHLSVTYDANTTELFSSPENELLQAEWTSQGFAMVRQGFKLTPSARAPAPPPAPAQPAQPQGEAAQPQQ